MIYKFIIALYARSTPGKTACFLANFYLGCLTLAIGLDPALGMIIASEG
jgi:hypothetical protein